MLLSHSAVAEAIVVGVPDEYSGELPRAYIVLKHNHKASVKEIQDHVKSKNSEALSVRLCLFCWELYGVENIFEY